MATTTSATTYIENIENILSREEYIAACKSNEVSNYRDRVIDEILLSLGPSLFEVVRQNLVRNLETDFQELVNATPVEIEILERDDIIYDGLTFTTYTLAEQMEGVRKERFNLTFQKLKKNLKERLRWAQRSQELTRAHL